MILQTSILETENHMIILVGLYLQEHNRRNGLNHSFKCQYDFDLDT